MGNKVRELRHEAKGPRGGRLIVFDCPGCGYEHPYEIDCEERGWKWNGSLDKPSFEPSLLVFGSTPEKRCHLYVRDGQIQFLPDCFHELKGQTVDMKDYEETQ